MKTRLNVFLAVLGLSIGLMAAPGLVSPAYAQAADTCGKLVANAQGQPQNHGGFPFDYPPDAGGVNKQEEGPPMPANPIKKVCEGGKVEILMGNHRHFDWKIGDAIPVTVLIRATPDVVIEFNTLLTERKISFEPTDFELFGEPKVVTQDQPDGSKLYEVTFQVQTFVPKDALILNLDLRYSTGFAEDGNTRVWQILTSPDFVVSRHWTVDHGQELLEGDLKKKPLNIPWATHLLLIGGIFLILFVPGVYAVKFANRVRTRNAPPPSTVAWRVFDSVLAEVSSMADFKLEHYKKLDGALRGYLAATLEVPVDALTLYEIHDRLADEEGFEVFSRVITLCEGVIYHGETRTEAENHEIVEGIKKLVPRHWDSK